MEKAAVMHLTDDPNAKVLMSAHNGTDAFGDPKVRMVISFLYDLNGTAAEWEPCAGPIQLWVKSGGGKPHYYYDFVEEHLGSWSLTAVYAEGLHKALEDNDYDRIYTVLRKWAERGI